METNIIEIWKDVAGFEGLYKISNLGNVKSLEKTYTSINKKGFQFTKVTHEKILKQAIKNGYHFVSLSKDNKSKFSTIHRLVAIAFCKSQYIGVRWLNKNQKWEARMYIDGKRVGLGWFDLENDAAEAYQNALKANNKKNKYSKA